MISFLPNLGTVIIIITNVLILILGYIVYRNNQKNSTNIFLFIYAILAAFWGIYNFFVFKVDTPFLFVAILRLILLNAVLINFVTYLISVTYPTYEIDLKNKKILLITLMAFITSLIVLSPLTVQNIKVFSKEERDVLMGPGIIVFGIVSSILNILAAFNLIKKLITADKKDKNNYIILILGFFLTFTLVIIFNFIFPNVFKITKFVLYGSVFMLPFILSVSYGIVRFRFLGIRLTASIIFITILLILTVANLFQAHELSDIIFRLLILTGLIIVSFFLINSIYSEVEYREKLEELNRLKSEFLSFASHQVKAPMAVVKGYAELIFEGIENVPEQAKDFAKKIKESVDNLLVLIEEFMDYRRIEEGKLEFNFEKLDIISLIREIVEKMKLLAMEKNLSLDFESKFDSLIMNVDKLRFSQVIQNLIDNAIKYTKEGWIRVKVDKEDNEVLISVSDSGIGMSKELQQKLFGQFVRDPSIKKEIRGTGLGLYIAKHIIEAHKGKIWAESEGVGKGSTFYIKLPIE
jgi:signal transduction histidine kinase